MNGYKDAFFEMALNFATGIHSATQYFFQKKNHYITFN